MDLQPIDDEEELRSILRATSDWHRLSVVG
jgi:hypothetical protein